jgi:hypothetical protein
MIKQPLFGQDSSPHKTSFVLSLIITIVLWVLFIIASFFIKFSPKHKQYKEIQIVLSSEKLDSEREKSTDKGEAAPEPAPAVQEVVQETVQEVVSEPVPVAVEEVAPAPAPKETPKPAAKTQTKPAPAPEKKAEPVKKTEPAKKEYTKVPEFTEYATDYSDFDFNNVSTSKPKEFDWSQFDDSSSASETQPQVSQKVEKVTTTSSVSGSAASTSTSEQRQTSSSSSSTTNKTTSTTSASSSTSSALSNIKSASYTASTGDSLKAITNAKTSKSSNGQISMQMKDGSTRVLRDPITPAIKLSSQAAALIDSDRTVTIEFRVLADGNVPRGEIKITPESILPAQVREEIYNQLCNWVFDAGPSAAYATFEYTIVKK